LFLKSTAAANPDPHACLWFLPPLILFFSSPFYFLFARSCMVLFSIVWISLICVALVAAFLCVNLLFLLLSSPECLLFWKVRLWWFREQASVCYCYCFIGMLSHMNTSYLTYTGHPTWIWMLWG
jgi:hypothetical protein